MGMIIHDEASRFVTEPRHKKKILKSKQLLSKVDTFSKAGVCVVGGDDAGTWVEIHSQVSLHTPYELICSFPNEVIQHFGYFDDFSKIQALFPKADIMQYKEFLDERREALMRQKMAEAI